MIILSVVERFFSSFNYVTAVFLLLLVFALIFKVVRRT